MPLDLAQHADRVLGTDGFFERNCESVRKARRAGHAEYFEKVLDAEKHATTIEEWCPMLFPGLLQTPACARAVVLAGLPLSLDEEVEEKVRARMARANLFEADHHTPEYWVILHESLITDSILPPAVTPSTTLRSYRNTAGRTIGSGPSRCHRRRPWP